MPLPKIGATHYKAQSGPTGKVRAIKGLVVCNPDPLKLLSDLALGRYQPYPEVGMKYISVALSLISIL